MRKRMGDLAVWFSVGLLVLAWVMLPELVAAARYLSFSYTEGDYLNDWITHVPDGLADWLRPCGILAADAGAGRLGIDYPWEDVLGDSLANAMYTVVTIIKAGRRLR